MRRTDKQRKRDLLIIADLYLKGHSYTEIAESLEKESGYLLARPTIIRDVSEAIKDWAKRAEERVNTIVGEELAKIDHLEMHYWRIYEEFDPNATGKTWDDDEDVGGFAALIEGMTLGKKSKPTDLRLQAMAGIQWCIDRRIKLLGADSPDRSEINVNIRTSDVNAEIAQLAATMRERMLESNVPIEAEFSVAAEDEKQGVMDENELASDD